MTQRPLVIHISGTPGSGKTTLGEKIAKARPDIRVIDTDDLLRDDTPQTDELISLERENPPGDEKYGKRWREIFTKEIHTAIDVAAKDGVRVLVFVGILDHWGGPKAVPLLIDNTSYRFYIDIATPQLLRQFYNRICILFTTEKDWNDVANNIHSIPGSDQVIRDAEKSRLWHISHKYELKSSTAIYEFVTSLSPPSLSKTMTDVRFMHQFFFANKTVNEQMYFVLTTPQDVYTDFALNDTKLTLPTQAAVIGFAQTAPPNLLQSLIVYVLSKGKPLNTAVIVYGSLLLSIAATRLSKDSMLIVHNSIITASPLRAWFVTHGTPDYTASNVTDSFLSLEKYREYKTHPDSLDLLNPVDAALKAANEGRVPFETKTLIGNLLHPTFYTVPENPPEQLALCKKFADFALQVEEGTAVDSVPFELLANQIKPLVPADADTFEAIDNILSGAVKTMQEGSRKAVAGAVRVMILVAYPDDELAELYVNACRGTEQAFAQKRIAQ